MSLATGLHVAHRLGHPTSVRTSKKALISDIKEMVWRRKTGGYREIVAVREKVPK